MKTTLIIFTLMAIIELLVLKYQRKIATFIEKNNAIGYVISSFFGIIPRCIGAFAIDSL